MKRNNQQGMRDKSQIRHLFAFRDICSFSKQEANHLFWFSFRIKFRKENLFSLEQNIAK